MGLKSAMKMAERPPLKLRSVLKILNILWKFTKMEWGEWFQNNSSVACTYLAENNSFALSIMSNIINVIWVSEEFYSHGP